MLLIKGSERLVGSPEEVEKAKANIKSLSGFVALNDIRNDKLKAVSTGLKRSGTPMTASAIKQIAASPTKPKRNNVEPEVEDEVQVGKFPLKLIQPTRACS